jgi:hypothetical protein
MTGSRCRRREYVAAVAALGPLGLAGCRDQTPATATPDETPGGDGASTATDDPATTEDATTQTGTGADLDLREANVVGVEVEADGDAYRFDVTLYHDDDGEDGYANWWQVESLDGERLGRRELLHAHSTDPFTRSETIEVPEGTTCVVVRGHDQTHGYGGQTMTVDVGSGETAIVRQGSERSSVSEADCP